MSVQFGRWNFDGLAISPEYVEKARAALAPYGPDTDESYSKPGLTILFRAFRTTKESHRESQPHVLASGTVITWDGRLDNRKELISELRSGLKADSTDLDIVSKAYETWGTKCFAKLIGDWALSIWDPRNQTVLLAKDSMGTNLLFYAFERNYIAWCSILDALVLHAGRTFKISEEYVAGWLGHYPAEHVTPYVGLHAVPASSFVQLRPGKHGVNHTVTKYWDFDPGEKIRYRTDAEYEEHFRIVFAQAVQLRLRSDRPILGELSGGVDSSSIVCMADKLMAQGQADCPRLDTISWFNSSIPDWDDPDYFSLVEKQRGRAGFHVDMAEDSQPKASKTGPEHPFLSEFENNRFSPVPVATRHHFSSKFFQESAAYAKSQGYRVSLSGVGGEQPTGGGIPSPTPELLDLLVRARFLRLMSRLNAWSAKTRTSRLQLLRAAVREFLPVALQGFPDWVRPTPSWLQANFTHRNHHALWGYASRLKLFGPLPGVQEHLIVLHAERRIRASWFPSPELLEERRFPFFDRDLREFAYSIPRDQIVGVGKRRFLLRRALAGIVPEQILNRKQGTLLRRETEAPAPQPKKNDPSTVWPSRADVPYRPVLESDAPVFIQRCRCPYRTGRKFRDRNQLQLGSKHMFRITEDATKISQNTPVSRAVCGWNVECSSIERSLPLILSLPVCRSGR